MTDTNMTDTATSDLTPILVKAQELQELIANMASRTPSVKKKSNRGNQKHPKIRHRYSSEPHTQTSFSMPLSMFDQLDDYAVAHDMTRTKVIVDALMACGVITAQMTQRESINESCNEDIL